MLASRAEWRRPRMSAPELHTESVFAAYERRMTRPWAIRGLGSALRFLSTLL